MWEWLVNNEQTFINQWRVKSNNALFNLNNTIANIDLQHHNVRTSSVCKECFDELLAQLVCLPNLPEELCRKTIVEIYYEQAVFNNQIWNNMNQTLFSQLNS